MGKRLERRLLMEREIWKGFETQVEPRRSLSKWNEVSLVLSLLFALYGTCSTKQQEVV